MLKRNRKSAGKAVPPPVAPAASAPRAVTPVASQPAATPVKSRSLILICLGLAALVLVLYARTYDHGFVAYDDDEYAYENPHLMSGLKSENIEWAFTHSYSSNWHPLTWLTHMLDWELYGDKAGGHHLTNAILHAINTALLFLLLNRLTGQFWLAAAVAALWAVHPLRVESVAWVSERKDVLSSFFFLLTLLAYTRYAQSPSVGRYALVAVLFALGLMAKPMLVTVPAVLLLLDFWPLGRFSSRASIQQCVIEKLPLLALSIISAIVTVHAQKKSVSTLDQVPIPIRAANAADAYLIYVAQMVAPVNLAAFYPHPRADVPAWRVLAGCVFLIGTTVGAYLTRNRYPYILVGWLWYLGMLVPVIGLVQVGTQSHADRYTYLPQIGLIVIVVWGVADLTRRYASIEVGAIGAVPARSGSRGFGRDRLRVPIGAAAVAMVVLAILSWQQTGYWRDTVTLFSHAIDSTTNNYIAHRVVGQELAKQGKVNEAEEHYRRAIEIGNDVTSRINLGTILIDRVKQGKIEDIDDAVEQFERAMEREPGNALARQNLAHARLMRGVILEALKRPAEAIVQFEGALDVDPQIPNSDGIRERLHTLYLALAAEAEKKGQKAEARELMRKAATISIGKKP